MVASVCQSQITDPGWFDAVGSIQQWDPGSGGTNSFTSGGVQTFPIVAETVTPEIQALARGLQNDPTQIYNYVHDHIRHVLYFGSLKGAQLTLLERSGNDFDQCSLLAALLQAAGYTNFSYQFGLQAMPYDASNHVDLHHWLGLSVVNTNWTNTLNYFNTLLGKRGFPIFGPVDSTTTNVLAFHRAWLLLTIGGTNYYLDPAFKVSEPVSGINLASAMGLNTNTLLSNSGGTDATNYVQSLNESSLRSTLQGYNSNLLATIQSNYPNATVQQIIGGQQIVPSAGTPLPTSQLFSNFTGNGNFPLQSWTSVPTNFMASMSFSFSGSNYMLYTPQLQGQRLSLTFDTNGVGKLWLEDTLLMQVTNTGSGSTVSVTLGANHPYQSWVNNLPVDDGRFDASVAQNYQRVNASYALIYGFEPGPQWLQERQQKLDLYRQQGLSDSSRQVVTETLNVMGLNWLVQTELKAELLGQEWNVLPHHHHTLGRMAQENGNGYYVDVYVSLSAEVASTGASAADVQRQSQYFDVNTYFSSAMEHGVIEQLQSSNIVAASTIKILELASTNGEKIYMATSNNWTSGANVRSALSSYADLSTLDSFIGQGYTLLLPQSGAVQIAGAGSWAGDGYAGRQVTTNGFTEIMKIGGSYNGGFSDFPSDSIDPSFVSDSSDVQPTFIDPTPPSAPPTVAADPVNMADATFQSSASDLSLGQAEPRGINFSRAYSSALRNYNFAGMANGWIHNYYFNLSPISAPQAGLGATTPQQMAPMIVATYATLNVYNNAHPDPKNWMVTALIAKWGIDQLINNAVSISMGKDTIQFIKQPDGSFTPPAANTMTLTKSGSAYNLAERHGNTFKFSTNGHLTNIVSQYTNVSLALTYNSSNLLSTVTDWKSRQLTFNYSGSPFRLVSITNNGSGRAVSYGYATNANGQLDLTSVTDPEGKTSTFGYDTNHQMTVNSNALNQLVVSNIYDAFGRVTTQYTQGDTNKTWQVFWTGFQTVVVDPQGGQQLYLFDDKSRQIGMQDALGNLTQTVYDGQDHVVTTISPMNETNTFIYDGDHNVLLLVDQLGFTNQFVYDSQNNLIHKVDPLGNTNTFGYNSKFQVTNTINGAGDTVSFFYNTTDGTLTNKTDAGGATSYGYDSFGQLSTITYPGSLGTNSFVNSSTGDVLTNTNPRGFVTSFQYNLRRQLTNTVAPTNLTAKIAYDAVGNVLSTTDPRNFSKTNIWSPTRHLLATTLPTTPQGVPVITNQYDSRDWLVRTLNPLQQPITYSNDVAGRLISAGDALSRTNTFGYDNDGRCIASTNAALETSSQQWSARGQLLVTTDPATNVVQHAYDLTGSQTLLTNRNGKIWQFQYDAANRLTNTISPLSKSISQTWNNRGLLASVALPSTHSASLTYDAKGRLTNRTDNVAATTYQYDPDDNRTNVVESGETNAWTYDAYDRVSSCTDTAGNVIQYQYDANGNLTVLTYPGGHTVNYSYDNLNRLTNVTDWANRQTTLTYDLANKLTSITRPNLTVRTLNYDAAGELTNIIEQAASHAPIAFFTLNYDAASRVKWEFAGPLPQPFTPPTRSMTFDDDNRLKTVNGQNVTNDVDGNMTWGPLPGGAFTNYTFDARNRLTGTGGLTYGYDATGNRISVTNGGNTTQYVVNPNAALPQVLMRTKGSVTTYYVYGAGLLYEVSETTTTTNVATYHFDSRGSTVALTDANGSVTDHIEYSAYGMVTYRLGTNDTPFLYNGRYGVQTDANGLLYMQARYYNPYLCRFINPDPSGFSGGLNFYAYADGNPISELDPFGLQVVGESTMATLVQTANTARTCMDCHGNPQILMIGILPQDTQWFNAQGTIAADQKFFAAMGIAGAGAVSPAVVTWILSNPYTATAGGVAAVETGVAIANGGPGPTPTSSLAGEMSTAGQAAETTAARNPNVYEALFQAPLSGTTRDAQRASANDFLATQLQNDPQLNEMFNQQLGGDVLQHMESGSGSSYLNPPGTVWHHPFDNPNIMQLLQTSEHTAPSLQSILHPGGVGGFGRFYGR